MRLVRKRSLPAISSASAASGVSVLCAPACGGSARQARDSPVAPMCKNLRLDAARFENEVLMSFLLLTTRFTDTDPLPRTNRDTAVVAKRVGCKESER